MLRLRIVATVVLWVSLVAGTCSARQVDLNKYLEFRDVRKTYGYVSLNLQIADQIKVKPWRNEEKEIILKCLSRIHNEAHGLLQRVMVGGPVRVYRSKSLALF